MNLELVFHRLKHVSKQSIPALFLAKMKRHAFVFQDRQKYSFNSPPASSSSIPKTLKPLGLLHADVLAPGFSELFQQEFSSETKKIIHEADNAVQHVFDLLGSGPIDLKKYSETIPWHRDFKGDFEWDPKTFFADIRYGDQPKVDIKVPWELSRCLHLVTLGQAYRLTGDKKYVQAFGEQIQDWIQKNPPKYGVNWVCAMDVALRACNWLLAWEFFRGAPGLPLDLEEKLACSLWEHGQHVFQYLEWNGDVSSNHYLSDLLGLAYMGVALSESRWVNLAGKELQKEIYNQVYEDGFDYEGSLCYHRLVLEIFFYFTLLESRNLSSLKVSLSSVYLEQVKKMFSFTQLLTMPNGRVPIVGDNDSGRVHVFSAGEDNDHRSLLNLGAAFFKDHQLKLEDDSTLSDLVWLFGFSGLQSYKSMPGKKRQDISSKAPDESGLATLRGADDFLLFSLQPNGTNGMANHTHNDKLSFTLQMAGDDFFIDPGTGIYTPDPALRNKFRSTAMHNTVVVDAQEQNRFMGDSLFALKNDAQVSIDQVIPGKLIRASHSGYKRLSGEVIHSRQIERKADPFSWIIEDVISGMGAHDLEWNFILRPGIQPQISSDHKIKLKGRHGEIEWMVIPWIAETSILDEIFSPAYGIVRPTKKIQMKIKSELPFKIKFNFVWKKGS